MKSIFALALKDLKLLWRNKAGLFWVLIFPLIMALFFGAIFSGSGGNMAGQMDIGVVDIDSTAYSQNFIKKLEEIEALKILKTDKSTAWEKVRKGKLAAYLILNKGFEESKGFFSGESTPIEIGIDPSRKAEAAILQGLVMETSFKLLWDTYSNPLEVQKPVRNFLNEIDNSNLAQEQKEVFKSFMGELDKFLGKIDPNIYKSNTNNFGNSMKITPVALNESSPRSSYEITFPAGIMWGLLACAATFGISIVSERVSGTLLRLKIAPLTSFQILAGKAAACFFACMLTLILLLGIAKIVFDIRILNISCLLLSIFSCSFAFVGIMMFISVLGSSQQAVSGAGWAIVCIMAMLGGGMVPLIAMPSWMLKLSHISPVKWGIYSLEGAIWRGFSFKEMLFPCCILVSSGIIFLTIGIILFSRQKL